MVAVLAVALLMLPALATASVIVYSPGTLGGITPQKEPDIFLNDTSAASKIETNISEYNSSASTFLIGLFTRFTPSQTFSDFISVNESVNVRTYIDAVNFSVNGSSMVSGVYLNITGINQTVSAVHYSNGKATYNYTGVPISSGQGAELNLSVSLFPGRGFSIGTAEFQFDIVAVADSQSGYPVAVISYPVSVTLLYIYL
ncbi:hypothetical protein [Thermogymnomonas acidicola]|uniref:hypothetical protein n=1 Tax=Thermogymnomonas acidicola TaxID=399579 RepID=UPI00139683B6|nr:hypothetical protein [Thermogymnomonas acidicola]